MSRGGSCGGGQSSLSYLFGSEEQQSQPPPPKTVSLPPYGIDTGNGNGSDKLPAGRAPSTSQVIDRSQGQHLGNILTDRPSTKVKSVPGGHSSLGYLFGDK